MFFNWAHEHLYYRENLTAIFSVLEISLKGTVTLLWTENMLDLCMT